MTISQFSSKVKGDVITADHPDYGSAISRWAKNAERNAKVVLFAKDAQDVVLSIAYAKEHNLPIAIRGGGHNVGGASSSEGGLVVDLNRHLNHVRVDPESKLGYVGGGAVWKDVDSEAIKYGLATVGGTVNHTGVGGLTLGGGYGWLSGRHGLSIDNLKQVTIVTADGSVLTANENQNSDLFWAVRGGGSNFGVVTEFVYQLHPQRPSVFAGFAIFNPDQVQKLVEVTKRWWEGVKEDEAMIQLAAISPEGQPCIAICFFYNGSEAEGRANFKDFFDIGPVADMAKEIPFEQLNAVQNDVVVHGKGYYLKGASQRSPHYESTMELLKKITEINKGGNFKPALLFEYFPLMKVNAVPVAATAFRRELTSNILTTLQWEGSVEKTAEARDLAKELIEIIVRGQADLSSSEKLGYSNYDPTAVRTEAAFGSNYPRLQNIKKKYDPENIFNRWFPIVPAN